MDTGREAESGTVVSRLSLARAREEDTGNYSCRLAKMPTRRAAASKNGLTDTVTVHVLRGENTEAIQGGAAVLGQEIELIQKAVSFAYFQQLIFGVSNVILLLQQQSAVKNVQNLGSKDP